MDILIVDDEPFARQRLQRLISELGHPQAAEASNGEQAMAAILHADPTVVLLDIEMPGDNGLQVAEKIAELDAPPAIIFTTAYDQYALPAFNTLASSYLLKPVNKEKLATALEKAQTLTKLHLQRFEEGEQKSCRDNITSKGHRGIELIPVDTIRYFRADQKYVSVIGTRGQALIDETLKDLEEEFSRHFLRVHRNALVSIKHILGLERDADGHYYVRLQDIEEKPLVSRRYASKVKMLLNNL